MLPLKDCYVTSPYGVVRSNGKVHTGIDLISKSGDREVRAIKSGTYRGSYWDAYGYGNYCVVENHDGIRTLYCHLKSVEPIKIGERICQGQFLGIEGTTGNSTGVHLHLEIRENPYTKAFHKDIADYLGIKNEKGYVTFTREEKEEQEENELRFDKLKDIPDGEFHDVTEDLIRKGIIKGVSSADDIEETVVDLSYDMLRLLVINYRAGIYKNA